MADNGSPNPQFLAPPAVTALRQEARNIHPKLARSMSDDMREERADLKEAAEQTLNTIVDLDLEGRIKWVSPSWKQVVGSAPETVEGRMISEILLDNKDVFRDAIKAMEEDDSRSRFIRFSVQMGPDSVLKYAPEPRPTTTEHQTDQNAESSQDEGERSNDVLHMEGQGIMVYDRTDNEAGHVSYSVVHALNQQALISITNTVYVDAPTVDRTTRSDNRSATPPGRIVGRRRGGSGELLDDTGRGRRDRARSLQTPCPRPGTLPHLRTPDHALVVRETHRPMPPRASG